MSISDDFLARFPEIPEAITDVYLPIVAEIWPSYYPVEYDATSKERVLQLMAHLVMSESNNATTGAAQQAISSQTVGSVSVSYSQTAVAADQVASFFATTKYGQRFLLLTNGHYGGVFV